MSEKQPSRGLANPLPCGCVQYIQDGKVASVDPCVPHGLIFAAEGLQQAAGALGSVGERMLQANAQRQVQAAAAQAASSPLPKR